MSIRLALGIFDHQKVPFLSLKKKSLSEGQNVLISKYPRKSLFPIYESSMQPDRSGCSHHLWHLLIFAAKPVNLEQYSKVGTYYGGDRMHNAK